MPQLPWSIILYILAFIGAVLAAAVILSIILQLYRLVKLERSLSLSMGEIKPPTKKERFTILDPYAGEGRYWKGQLHMHVKERSWDATMPFKEAAAGYAAKGFDFLAVTDHNRPGAPDGDGHGLLIIPGSEDSYPWPFLGHHFLRLNTNERMGGPLAARLTNTYRRGGIAGLAHPSWRGGLGMGRWLPLDVPMVDTPYLVEIASRYSNSVQENVALWHYLLNRQPFPAAIWAAASDDLHAPLHLGLRWVMVKSPALNVTAIIDALARGSFYASSGPTAEFGVVEGAVSAKTNGMHTIRFINNGNKVVFAARAESLTYRPEGNEGFIRVEVESDNGQTAWSQPFFLAEPANTK